MLSPPLLRPIAWSSPSFFGRPHYVGGHAQSCCRSWRIRCPHRLPKSRISSSRRRPWPSVKIANAPLSDHRGRRPPGPKLEKNVPCAGRLLGTPGAKRREAVSERVHRPAECSAGLTAPGFLPRRRALGGACWPIAPFRLAGDSASTQLPLYVSQPHPSRFSFHPDHQVPSKPEMPFRLSTCLRGGHFDACRQERRPAEGGTLGPTGAWPQGEASALRR